MVARTVRDHLRDGRPGRLVALVSECVLWTGRVKEGYGILYLGRNPYRAHRVFYLLYNGKIPRGHHVHHACETKLCVNPEHLVAMTADEHLRLHAPWLTSASGDARRARPYCKNGHEYAVVGFYVERNQDGSMRRRCRVCSSEKCRRYRLSVAA